jgi:hypothetical protein
MLAVCPESRAKYEAGCQIFRLYSEFLQPPHEPNSARKERPMPAANYLPEVLQTTEAERLATGFIFTEGPLWHPEGYWYFVDLRQNKLFRVTPGHMVGHRGDDGRA